MAEHAEAAILITFEGAGERWLARDGGWHLVDRIQNAMSFDCYETAKKFLAVAGNPPGWSIVTKVYGPTPKIPQVLTDAGLFKTAAAFLDPPPGFQQSPHALKRLVEWLHYRAKEIEFAMGSEAPRILFPETAADVEPMAWQSIKDRINENLPHIIGYDLAGSPGSAMYWCGTAAEGASSFVFTEDRSLAIVYPDKAAADAEIRKHSWSGGVESFPRYIREREVALRKCCTTSDAEPHAHNCREVRHGESCRDEPSGEPTTDRPTVLNLDAARKKKGLGWVITTKSPLFPGVMEFVTINPDAVAMIPYGARVAILTGDKEQALRFCRKKDGEEYCNAYLANGRHFEVVEYRQ
jgi:hypothetical protein